MSEPELLPCPFCGGPAEVCYGSASGETARVECRGDDCQMDEIYTDRLPRADAIAAWNRRIPASTVLPDRAPARDTHPSPNAREAALEEVLGLADTIINRLPANGEHWSLIQRYGAAVSAYRSHSTSSGE